MRGREHKGFQEAESARTGVDMGAEVKVFEALGYTEMSAGLIAGMRLGVLECVICLGGIRSTDALWTCDACHCILHAVCVREWARSATIDALYVREVPHAASGATRPWTCALCQSPQTCAPPASLKAAAFSMCWCKRESVSGASLLNRNGVPRSCGNPCGWNLGGLQRERVGEFCPHRCSLPCHPGMMVCARVIWRESARARESERERERERERARARERERERGRER
jgi:hypothetical protein